MGLLTTPSVFGLWIRKSRCNAACRRPLWVEPAVIEGLLRYDGVIIGQRTVPEPHASYGVGLLAVVVFDVF